MSIINGISSIAISSHYDELKAIDIVPDNYSTIALAIASGSKKIFIRNGTYNEGSLEITDDDVVIEGESRDGTIICVPESQDGIKIYANSCKIKSLKIDALTNSAEAALVIGDGKESGSGDYTIGNDNTIIDCNITGGDNTFALYVAGPSYTAGETTLTAYDAEEINSGNKVVDCIMSSPLETDAFVFALQKKGEFTNNICNGGRIAFYMCRESSCSFNKSYDSASQGIYIGGPANNNTLAYNQIYSSTNSGITLINQVEHTPLLAGQGIHNNLIVGNQIIEAGLIGIEISGDSAKSHIGNKIDSNFIKDSASHGIYMQYTEDNDIINNRIDTVRKDTDNARASCIYMVASVIGNNISGNTLLDEQDFVAHNAISNREDTTCINNVIQNNHINVKNTERTVWIQSAGTIIKDNYINGGYYAGLYLDAADDCVVMNNILENNTNETNNTYSEITLASGAAGNIILFNTMIAGTSIPNIDIGDSSGETNDIAHNYSTGCTSQYSQDEFWAES